MVRFACPLCAAMVQMPDDQVGRRRPCPECGERILVSAPETTPQPVLVDTLPPPQELPPPTTVEEETVSLDPPAPPPVRERSSLRLVQVATCPFCSTRMRIPPDTPSPQFQCPSCHQVFTVAGSTSSPATRPPPPPPPGLRGLTVLGVVVLILALATTAAWGLPRALTWIQTLQAQQETIPNQAASEDNNPPEDTTGPRAPPEGASQAPRENPTPPPQPPPVSPEAVHQTLVSLTDPMAPAPDSKDWADASRYAVQQGPLRVRVEDLSARADQVQIHLQVENESTDRTLQFQKWSTAQGGQAPTLSSDLASSYTFVPADPSSPAPVLLPPGKSVADMVSFQVPAFDAVAFLRLGLPAEVFGGSGQLHVQIPGDMVLIKTAPTRGSLAVPALVRALEKGGPDLRRAAAAALGEIGSAGGSLVLIELRKALQDQEAAVRLAAVQALARMGPAAHPALADLLQASGDSDEKVRQAAAQSLTSVGPLTRADLPTLEDALQASNPNVRRHALDALAKLGPEASPAVPDLLALLQHPDKDVRAAAVTALGASGTESPTMVQALSRALADPDVLVRRQAVAALAGMSRQAGAASALIRALNDPDPDVAQAAARAVERLRPFTRAEVPALTALLKSSKPDLRLYAVTNLEALGPQARESLPALLQALRDPDLQVRERAVSALGTTQSGTWSAVVPVLGHLLEDRDPALRRMAVTALGTMGEGARPAVPNLIKLLDDKDLHDQAAEALVKIGRGAVPDLVVALDDHDFRRRLEAIVLLGKIGPEAREALGPLSTIASGDQYPRVRRAADEALKQIQR